MSIVYVLKLKDGFFYIGKTSNLKVRINQHFSGQGCQWTKIHPPIQITDNIVDTGYCELAWTLKYMELYGIDKVRGSCYSNVSLTSGQKEEIQKHIWAEGDRCLKCGSYSHFINSCPVRTWMEKLFGCCTRSNIFYLDFGKYNGMSYNYVYENDPEYCEWVKKTNSNSASFKKFKKWLESAY